MSGSNALKLGLAMAGLAALGGCADYLNHRDTITLAAGNSKDANAAIHTIDPQANRADRTHINADGKIVRVVMDQYHTGPTPVELTADVSGIN